MGNANHGDSGINGNLKVLGKSAGMVKPGEGTFYHPAPREFLPLMGLYLPGNINA